MPSPALTKGGASSYKNKRCIKQCVFLNLRFLSALTVLSTRLIYYTFVKCKREIVKILIFRSGKSRQAGRNSTRIMDIRMSREKYLFGQKAWPVGLLDGWLQHTPIKCQSLISKKNVKVWINKLLYLLHRIQPHGVLSLTLLFFVLTTTT